MHMSRHAPAVRANDVGVVVGTGVGETLVGVCVGEAVGPSVGVEVADTVGTAVNAQTSVNFWGRTQYLYNFTVAKLADIIMARRQIEPMYIKCRRERETDSRVFAFLARFKSIQKHSFARKARSWLYSLNSMNPVAYMSGPRYLLCIRQLSKAKHEALGFHRYNLMYTHVTLA